jgi:hypothetical protein
LSGQPLTSPPYCQRQPSWQIVVLVGGASAGAAGPTRPPKGLEHYRHAARRAGPA